MYRDSRRWMKGLVLGAAALVLTWPGQALARTNIIGGLGNFDVYNETEDECDEFEIELEGAHPEDVYHTYYNPNYGPPTITSLPGNTGIRVTYAHPKHTTAIHGLEHFGVSLKDMSIITAQRFQWKPVYKAPPPPLEMPMITTEIVDTPAGPKVRETVLNADTFGRAMWVQRRETVAAGEVRLEQLMPDDPLILGANLLDLDPELIEVGVPLINDEGLPSPGDIESEVIAYEVYADKVRWNGDEWIHEPGQMIGTALIAAVTQGTVCGVEGTPTITLQPSSIVGQYDKAVAFIVEATGPDTGGQLSYQWRFENQIIPDEDSPILKVDCLPETLGSYACIVTNDCGSTLTQAAWLTVPPCPQDFDYSGFVDTDDFDKFVQAFEAGTHHADFDESGFVDTDDFDAFVRAFEIGC
ncbi:MAG: hypothetical protein AMXMBFR58_31930 [Phycisphaerae bacterium]